MIEQARAQLVDHPLADRNGDVIRHDVEQAEQRVQDDEGYARGCQQLAARHRWNPFAHHRRAAQHIVDYNLERPRLEHLGRRGKQHTADCDRETAQMRTHPANNVAVKFQRAHHVSPSERFAIEIPSAPAASAAQTLMIAGIRRARLIANSPTAIAAHITPAIPARAENPAASKTSSVIAAAISPRRGADRRRQSSAMPPSLWSNAFIGTRIIGATTISRS